MKRILLAIALLFFATAAAATELVTDPTLTVNPFTAMGSNWSVSGGKLIGAGVYGTRAGQTISIPRLTKVRYTVTISSYTSGNIQLSVGAPLMSIPGVSKPVTDGANGLIHIPDNFTTSLGLYASTDIQPADPNHSNATFRFTCQGHGKVEASDPMVVPNQPGKSHLHRFNGNQGVSAYTTYTTLRRSGADNCGNGRYSPQRSAYWHPALLNGKGAVVFPIWEQFYYRQIPNGASVCNPPMTGPGGRPDLTGNYVGKCVMIPNGLAYLAGYSMGTGLGGPGSAEDGVELGFECRQRASMSTRDTTANGTYASFDAMLAAGCPRGAVLYVYANGKDCWNGTEVDSTDHNSHMSWHLSGGTDSTYSFMASDGLATGRKCPSTHPYKIPTFAWQQFYITDDDFYNGHWRFSSDEMLNGAAPHGKTFHIDYMEGWGDYKLGPNGWHQRVINEGRSTSEGSNGVGLQFINPSGQNSNIQYNGGGQVTDLTSVTMKPAPRLGLSRPISGTGTFTGELTALSGDQIYVTSPDGFVGEIDYVSFDTTTPVSVRDGTITHTSH